jgi:spore cortex formation protein SpoVR/YcgB (stage V sporulation)
MNDASEIYTILQATGLNPTLSRFAVAQAAHETNNFTSSIYKNNHNAFGMKFAGQVNALGEKSGHAYYAAVNNSVADLVAWYTRKRSSILSLPLIINSIESYVRFLKNNNYFEADESEYLKGCKHFYDLYFG